MKNKNTLRAFVGLLATLFVLVLCVSCSDIVGDTKMQFNKTDFTFGTQGGKDVFNLNKRKTFARNIPFTAYRTQFQQNCARFGIKKSSNRNCFEWKKILQNCL